MGVKSGSYSVVLFGLVLLKYNLAGLKSVLGVAEL